MKLAQRAVQLGFALALFAAWYLLTLPGRINPILLPPPVPVLHAFGVLVTSGGVWPDVLVTVYEWLVAFALGALTGCIAGYLVSLTPFTVRVFDPLLAGFYSIPAILLYPLYLLFFGLGPASKIAIGTTIAFFPVVLNTIAGFGVVNRSYIRAARSMGADDLQLFGTVLLPAALPVVLTGLRLGGIVAFMTILGCEMISSLSGLGHRIVELAENMEPVRMFANIIVAVLLAFAINAGVSYAEARGKGWTR